MALARMRTSLYYLIGFIGLRRDDILLASYPRSGNTWLRFTLCNLISLLEWGGKAVDFHLLNETMPELGVSNLLVPWSHESMSRVVKTHVAYSPLLRKRRAIGVIRDPRDVMVSYYHYRKTRQRDYSGGFAEFIRDRRFGLEPWFKHYTSWQDHWMVVVKYEDMLEDSLGEFHRVLEVLGVTCSDDILREAIDRSAIANVSKAEGNGVPTEASFARDGRAQQWPAYFGEEDRAYYEELAGRYEVDVYLDR